METELHPNPPPTPVLPYTKISHTPRSSYVPWGVVMPAGSILKNPLFFVLFLACVPCMWYCKHKPHFTFRRHRDDKTGILGSY
jgi:hypothetical protein